ncbi:DsbE family thiol:disulfide interchange protein [Noviherbaspirillum sp. CPCC 100848]|uniref:DsbE family thiol:disulfide interchange protein n=1 Tax=Noviherbaspirillum album TaxID=3080276 RepID=A0ABU6JIX7_9BURK|nr:DsbE family thiol:disulfide interchange protein [Noviherbaspirillum sp. CPCC 100848]MEC4723637.1 DsbE family thiol:disulfide interchange protein [Noviherbaspirillum sp. CPCC 100848]
MKRFLPFAIFVGLLIFLGIGLRLNPRDVPSPFIGKPAPAFEVAQLQQPDATISSGDMRGKVWLLNVWASWCAACRVEHPALMELARSNVVPIIGLNYKDERSEGVSWLQQHGDPYAVSAYDKDGRIGIDFGVYGVPETFVVDKQGIIRLKHTGPVTAEFIKKTLIPLLNELENA